MRYNTTQVPSRWCMVHVLEVIHGASGARARGDAWCKLPHGNAQARVLRRRAQAFSGQLCRSTKMQKHKHMENEDDLTRVPMAITKSPNTTPLAPVVCAPGGVGGS